MLCKIWGFRGGDYEECRLLGYKNLIFTSQETHYSFFIKYDAIKAYLVGGTAPCIFNPGLNGGLPLWSSAQSSWLQTQRSWVRFPTLPNFLRSNGSGTGSTQPHEHKWGATWKKISGSGLEKLRLTAVGDPPRWPRDTPLSAKVGTKFRRQVSVAQSV
jgi:hypothetical protein